MAEHSTGVPVRCALMIGALGSGGAEHQLMRLALALREYGYAVEVWCYTSSSRYDVELRNRGVCVRTPASGDGATKRARVRCWIKEFRPHIVHCFMKRASSLGVIARGLSTSPAVIGSDLSTATYGQRGFALFASLVLFRFCSVVTTQTQLNRSSLEKLAPWLRGHVRVIRNGLDLTRFFPRPGRRKPGPLRFVCVGSVYSVKNPFVVVEAAAQLHRDGLRFQVDWYGRLGLDGDHDPSEDYFLCQRLIEREGLKEKFRFHGESSNILKAYHDADVILHASVQEGFPNAVAEGMACGLPVVVSRVSDLPLVIQVARNGFVFDERNPDDLARAMRWILDTDEESRGTMGERSRELATDWFALDRFVEEYVGLYGELLGRPV